MFDSMSTGSSRRPIVIKMRPSGLNLTSMSVPSSTAQMLSCASTRTGRGAARGAGSTAPHRGVYDLELPARGLPANPFFDPEVKVRFTRPDGTSAVVDAFFDGGRTFRARAYCDAVGAWSWQAEARGVALGTTAGRFEVGRASCRERV